MKTIDNDIKMGQLKRAYLLYGEERYLLRQYRNKLLKAMVSPDDTMNFSSYEGADINEKEIIDMAETLPFFADRRVILIEKSGLFKKGGEALAEYLPTAPESTVFLFVEDEVDARLKLYKAVKKIGNAIEFKQQTEEMLQRWVLSRLSKEGKNITQAAYQLFISKTGAEMENIDHELEKLICFCMEKEVISIEDVDMVTTERTQNKVFDMVEAITAKQQKKALDLYYDLIALREPPMRILYLITRQFHQLMVVKSMTNQGFGNKDIAGKAGCPEWAVKKYQSQCRIYSLEQLKTIIREAVELEQAVKTGQMDDQMAVEVFIVDKSRKNG